MVNASGMDKITSIWGETTLPAHTRQAIAVSVPMLIYATDLQDRVRFMNRLPGDLQMSDVIEHDVYEFIAPEDHVVARECREIVLNSGEPLSYIASPGPGQSGEWYEVWVSPLVVDGQRVGLSAAVTDITDLKHVSTAYAEAEGQRVLQERLFRVLIEQSSEMISIVSGRGEFLYVSPAHQKILGYSVEDLRRNSVQDIIHVDDRRMAWKFLRRSMQTPGTSVTVPVVRLRHQDGNWKSFEVLVNDMRHLEGIDGLVLSARDISERLHAEKDVRNFKTIADRANYGTLITDMDGVIFYVNDAMAEMHGLEVGQILGHDQTVFHTAEQFLQLNEFMQEMLRDGQVASRELWHARRDGSGFPVLVSGSVVQDADGDLMFISSTYIDISDLKKKEEEIRRFNATLEDRVQQRTVELQEAQAQLVESEKMASLGGLVAGVAHEINTPVGVGVTASTHLHEQTRLIYELFHSDAMKKSDLVEYLEISREASKLISINLERAAGLIRSFKKVAIDQSTEDVQVTNLKSCLETTLSSLGPSAKRTVKCVELNCPDHLETMLNPGDISQILTNLVMNSLSHGFSGRSDGVITIDVTLEDGQIVWHYHDNGAGMSAEVLKNICEPFFTTRPSMENSGLGMHIVYNIVTQKLKGRLICSSDPGQGADFDIRFPLTTQ